MLLARLGSILLRTVGIVTGVVPLLKPIMNQEMAQKVQTVADDFTKMGEVVVTGEQFFAHAFGPDAKMGPQKLAGAVPFFVQIIQTSELFAGKKLKDPDKLNGVAQKFADAMVEAYACFEEK